jgi:hypothetical protein
VAGLERGDVDRAEAAGEERASAHPATDHGEHGPDQDHTPRARRALERERERLPQRALAALRREAGAGGRARDELVRADQGEPARDEREARRR